MIWIASNNRSGFCWGKRWSIDRPSQVIMARGMGGDAQSHWRIHNDGRSDVPPPSGNKPPYRVPSMAEILAVKPSGLTVVSTFAGCGGSSLGYRMAGLSVLWASEFVPIAQESYRANAAAGTILDGRDIRTVTAEEILIATGKKPGEIDVLDGSPPCQAFSTAGTRARGWGKKRQYEHGATQCNETLFSEYVRILRGLRPRAFVAENVSGLVKGVAKGFFLEILADLKASGYRVACRVLDAQWLGVPQSRSRTFFVGIREDLNLEPAHPLPLKYQYTVRDALPWIGQVVHDTRGNFRITEGVDRPCDAITTKSAHHFKVQEETPDISRYAIGGEWRNLAPGQRSQKYPLLSRAPIDGPSPTICASTGRLPNAGVTHPTECRKFTIAELRRLCGFPDDFILHGSYAQQWERLGNSVPPVMMSHVAASLRDALLSPRPPHRSSASRPRARR